MGANAAVGIYSTNSSVYIRNVTIYVSGGANSYGIHLNGNGAQVRDVNISVPTTGTGIAAVAGNHYVSNAIISAGTTGISVGSASTIRLFGGWIAAGADSLAVDPNGSLRVANALVHNGVSGTPTCVGAFTSQFVALNTACK